MREYIRIIEQALNEETWLEISTGDPIQTMLDTNVFSDLDNPEFKKKLPKKVVTKYQKLAANLRAKVLAVPPYPLFPDMVQHLIGAHYGEMVDHLMIDFIDAESIIIEFDNQLATCESVLDEAIELFSDPQRSRPIIIKKLVAIAKSEDGYHELEGLSHGLRRIGIHYPELDALLSSLGDKR